MKRLSVIVPGYENPEEWWERVRYEITELMKWIKRKCTKAGRPFKMTLFGNVPLTVSRDDETTTDSSRDGGE